MIDTSNNSVDSVLAFDSAHGIGRKPTDVAVEVDVAAGQALVLTEQQFTSIDLTSRRVTGFSSDPPAGRSAPP